MTVLSRLALLCVAALMSSLVLPPAATAAEGVIRNAGGPNSIADSYVVVLKEAAIDSRVAALTARHGGRVRHVFRSALHGYAATMSERAARRVAADPAVAYVEQDGVVRAFGTQTNPPSWGLDRIDQRSLPLDRSYTYEPASNVHVYVIDSGIGVSHTTFAGRAVWGVNTSGDGVNADCSGHGTHVAGTVGGTQYGVAKAVRLVAVKVLGCNGSGTFAGAIAGVDWVTRNAVRPAVATISFGAPGGHTALESAVRNSIASGVTYVAASGNSNVNACDITPARVPEVITVNASDRNDYKASFSNFGPCTDLYAPGVDITSADISGGLSGRLMSGTSMSAAHVAGLAAIQLSSSPASRPADTARAMTVDGVRIVNWASVLGPPHIAVSQVSPFRFLLPDLVVTRVDQALGLLTVKNAGISAPNTDFIVAIYDSGVRRAEYPQFPLAPGQEHTVQFNVLIWPACAEVIADHTYVVPEFREDNNSSGRIGPCLH